MVFFLLTRIFSFLKSLFFQLKGNSRYTKRIAANPNEDKRFLL